MASETRRLRKWTFNFEQHKSSSTYPEPGGYKLANDRNETPVPLRVRPCVPLSIAGANPSQSAGATANTAAIVARDEKLAAKAWEITRGMGTNTGVMLLMFYLTGSTGLFSIFIIGYNFKNVIMSFFNINTAFKDCEDICDKSLLLVPKAAYFGFCVLAIGWLTRHCVHSGLLPTNGGVVSSFMNQKYAHETVKNFFV